MRLTDCFMELLAYAAYFLSVVVKKQPIYDKVRDDINELIVKSEKMFKESDLSQKDYDLARFAVFAWIDESIMLSRWKSRDIWQGELLQRKYYKTAQGGVQFFENFNNLAADQNEVREIYYFCLSLGFTGRYCNEGDEILLDQLKSANLKVLTGKSSGINAYEDKTIFPDSYHNDTDDLYLDKKYKRKFSFLTLFFCVFPFVLFGILFVIYRFILENEIIIKMVS